METFVVTIEAKISWTEEIEAESAEDAKKRALIAPWPQGHESDPYDEQVIEVERADEVYGPFTVEAV